MHKPEVVITQKQKEILTWSQGLMQCFEHSKLGCAWIDGVRLQKTASRANFQFWVMFLLPVCTWCCSPKSPWYRFPLQSNNYFRYPSAILEFLGEESDGWVWHKHHWKSCPPKHRYNHWHIVSVSVTVVKLLVFRFGVLFLLPICTGCFSPKSDDVGTCGSGSNMTENCV